MPEKTSTSNIKEVTDAINEEIHRLPLQNVPNLRIVRRRYSQEIKYEDPHYVLELAREIYRKCSHRWIALELINNHNKALRMIGEAELNEFGRGMNSWGAVDAFAGFLSGPEWLKGQIPDDLIHKWAMSNDRWWRRAALVSTVVLNKKSCGGKGDIPRTLKVCEILANDHDDMVVKAMSWALRELIPHDPDAVREFLARYDNVLASRIKREVNNKLTTGLKNPGQKKIKNP